MIAQLRRVIARVRLMVAPKPEAAAGFAGQALNFLSMLVPIVTHREQALVVLVFVSSLASALVFVATAGIANRFAGLRDVREVYAALATAIAGLLAICALLVTIAVADPAPLHAFRLELILTAALLFGQGLGVVAVSAIVRARAIVELYWYRLAMGCANLPLAVVACTVLRADHWLTVAAATAQLLALTVPGFRLRHNLRSVARRVWWARGRPMLMYLRNSWAVIIASGANSVALNAAGLAVVGLGTLAAPWAAISRLAGGFVTTTQQLVAPVYEGEFGFGHRVGDEGLMNAVFGRAVRAGYTVGGIAVTAAVAGALVTHAFWTLTTLQKVVLVTAAFTYWGSLLALSLIQRFLTLMGRAAHQMAWDVTRAVAVLAILAALTGASRLLVLGVCIAGFAAVYLELLMVSLRRPRVVRADAHAEASMQS